MSEAAAQCIEIFSLNSLKNICGKHRLINHQYTTTHIEQLIDALDHLCACIFCTKTGFLPFPVICETFDYIERRF